ncbi:unnamed protein product [Miscanthus lutarioriparius]|uniref:Helicase C-terminal domain-containing protein n=1 Tax=Miscanthus lutarioriparius TaxID=422564 RepID=A0A811QM37_9POAL|nr:unnamed protein product [Miscanthus lutarioriparius]
MEIIELSSESEGEGFVDLCSDGEDRTVLCSDSTVSCSSDREDDGYGDRSTRFRPPIQSLSLSTASDENSDEEPIMLEVDSFLSDTRQASSFYRPAENRPATGKISKLTKKDLLRQPITSVIDAQADIGSEVPEKSLFSVDEKVVYDDALQYIQQEKMEEDLPEDVLSVSLLKHQKIALAWMVSRENNAHCSGGILADDQGLGKTISTIALIQKERLQQSRFMSDDSECGISVGDDNEAALDMDKKELKVHASRSRAVKAQPKKARVSSTASSLRPTTSPAAGTLVVCPASVLNQWANELSTKVTRSAELSVLVYHGGSRTRDPTELADYDVVVTTYTIVAREVPKENTNDKVSPGNKRKLKKNAKCKTKKINKPGPLAKRPMLKNNFCRQKDALGRFFSGCGDIQHPADDGLPSAVLQYADDTLIVLKGDQRETLLDGEPIIKIPPKTIQLSKIDFTKEERAFYLRLEENSRQTLKGRSKDFIQKNYVHILALLSQLRQACNHPFLLKGKECAHSVGLAKQLPVVTAVNLLKVLESGAAKCTICGVCPASPHCGREISAENLLFTDVLKFCLWPNLESEAPTSHSIDVRQPFSVCESSYVSSKIRNTIDILNSIINTGDADDTMGSVPSESTPVKAIVFTQWTGMLDLLERSLSSNHIEFRRLDGSMPLNVREKAVKEFNTDPEVRVIIMSLKAGNLGLNMVAACHVLMLDPWWNPSAVDQAVDRAHRIGQTRPVTVSRLTVKDAVEDRILSLQEGKRKMIESALGEDPSGDSPATRLTVEDLKYLFKM